MAKRRKTMSLADVKLASDVKRANQRLRQLEKSGVAKNNLYYKNLQALAQKGANYLGTTKHGEMKYRTDITKMSASEKKALRRNVTFFLQSEWTKVKTARKKIKETYKKGYQTVKANTGTNLSEKEYYDLWEQLADKNLDKLLSSSQTMEVITNVSEYRSDDEIIDALEELKKENKTYRDLIKNKFGLSFDQDGNIVEDIEKKKDNKKIRSAKNNKLKTKSKYKK